MPFTKALKGKRIMDAPTDIGTRPVRSRITMRLCKNCIHYNAGGNKCKFFERIENPDWAYCSWWKEKI